MIRIIGGTHKGRVIRTPRGRVRPATSRVKQSLFDYLSNLIPGARVLDLYAGSGGFGLESLSRGAERVLFVDLSVKSITVAKDNTEALGFSNKAQFICKDVFRFLHTIREEPVDTFDVVFAAPPYRKAEPQRILESLDESGALGDEAVICLEYSRHMAQPSPESDRLILDRRKVFGETVIEVWDFGRS